MGALGYKEIKSSSLKSSTTWFLVLSRTLPFCVMQCFPLSCVVILKSLTVLAGVCSVGCLMRFKLWKLGTVVGYGLIGSICLAGIPKERRRGKRKGATHCVQISVCGSQSPASLTSMAEGCELSTSEISGCTSGKSPVVPVQYFSSLCLTAQNSFL